MFSNSQNINWLELGRNPESIWKPQLEILLMWGTTNKRPGFMKLLPGAINSVISLTNAIWESGLQDVIAIMDKGFYSQSNIDFLEKSGIQYAIALSRGLRIIEYKTHPKYNQYFHYKKHAQWWRSTDLGNGRMIYHYLDKTMADTEESNYLAMVDEGKVKKTEFNRLKRRFGTLSIITDTGLSAEKVYHLYKERREIEYAFEAFKKTLNADVTWMRSKESLQGYLFIHFIALHLYSQVLDHLKRKALLERYSVMDILTYLSKV
jgi:transposase